MLRLAAGPLALAAVAVAGLSACGASPRDRVADYVRSANAILSSSAPAVRSADEAYALYASGGLPPAAAVPGLAQAEQTIAATRGRLARLSPPPPARRLQMLILAVFADDQELAAETSQLAVYTPASAAARRQVRFVDHQLRSELARDAAQPPAQAADLLHYATALRAPLARLSGLQAPPVLATSQAAEIRRLRSIGGLAQRLAAAILARDAAAVARLLLAFRAANVGRVDQSSVARGIAAYRGRLKQIALDTAAMQHELGRLNGTLR